MVADPSFLREVSWAFILTQATWGSDRRERGAQPHIARRRAPLAFQAEELQEPWQSHGCETDEHDEHE